MVVGQARPAGGTVMFRIAEGGKLYARMADDPEEEEYELDATVADLRIKLAEDIFANPDVFDRNDLRDMLPATTAVEDRQQRLSVEATYERRVYMLAIKSRSHIGGGRLENITTANLRDLAEAALNADGNADPASSMATSIPPTSRLTWRRGSRCLTSAMRRSWTSGSR